MQRKQRRELLRKVAIGVAVIEVAGLTTSVTAAHWLTAIAQAAVAAALMAYLLWG